MDDLILIIIWFVIAMCVLLCVFIVGSLAAVCVFGAGIHGVASTMWQGVRHRGGAGAAPGPGEPAFRPYYRAQVWADLRLALGAGARRAREERLRIESAVPKSAGGVGSLFRVVMRIYGWYAYVLGALVAIPVALVLALAVALLGGVAWAVGAPLRTAERIRRRVRGAHYDCAVCRDRFALPVYVCPECGARHKALVPGPFGVLRRRCECDANLPTLQLNGRQRLPAECPEFGHPLGEAVGAVRTLHVPVAAGPSAGKTTFLAAALLELEQRAAAGTVQTATQRSSRDGYERLLDGFRAGVLPAKTADTMAPALVAEVRGEAKSALLYAYDVAGEAYADDSELRRDAAYGLADGVVLLIDPFALSGVRADREADLIPELAASSEAPQRVLERLIGVLAEKGVDPRALPVAICVTKVDALDIEGEIAGSGGGDDAERVRSWLLAAGAGNLLRAADETFAEIRCFKVSALGRATGTGSGPFVPRGSLDPLLWLLRKGGIEPAAAGRAAPTTTSRLSAAPSREYKPKRPRSTAPIDAVMAGGYLANFCMGLLALDAIGGVLVAAGGVSGSTSDSTLTSAAVASSTTALPSAPTEAAVDEEGQAAETPAPSPSDQSSTQPTAATERPPRPAGAADSVLRRHFERIDRGDYSGAYALMTSGYRAANPRWAVQPEEAQPRISIASVGRPQISGHEAWVSVKFYAADTYDTASSDTRCRRFEGLAHLVKEAGHWRYDPERNDLSRTALSSSMRVCP